MFTIAVNCPASCDRGTNNPVTGVTYFWLTIMDGAVHELRDGVGNTGPWT